MNVSYPTCTCGAVNTTKQSGWVRVFGVYADAPEPILSSQLARNPTTGQVTPLPTNRALVTSIDKCPACVAKLDAATLTVLQHDTMTMTANKPAVKAAAAANVSAKTPVIESVETK
ncbi:MAG TPA: hypothetical protein VGN23_07475 [Verrucomicrobiae bacterium]|jgi:hypothetical protein